MLESDRNAIRERAYFIWEHEGRPDGRAQDHWLWATFEHFRDKRTDEFVEDEEKVLLAVQTRIFRRC